jgi:hypothetical protein
MNLYHIKQSVNYGYETFSDAVVVANNEIEASLIHPDMNSEYFEKWPFVENEDGTNWDRNDWAYTPDQVTVEFIGIANDKFTVPTVICSSYHAG